MDANWNSTTPEPYILTEEDEARVLENELASAKKYYAWRMWRAGAMEGQILQKLAEVDWTDVLNVADVLERANSNKLYEQWQRDQRHREKLEAEEKAAELKRSWTAGRMYRLIKWTSEHIYGKVLIENDDTMALIRIICYFLSRDPRLETEAGFSLKKGLLLRGVSGLGKSHIVQCAAANELNPVLVVSMLEIEKEIKTDGEYEIPMQGQKILYLDDVGTEETPVNYFGTKINWFKDFIELYYAKHRPFPNLVISTNNDFRQLEEKYGFRVRSRVKDMFNIVDVKGNDLRGLAA